MFTRKEIPKYQQLLEIEIETLLASMATYEFNPEVYEKKVALIERLTAMLDNEKPARVSPETRASIVANLMGILMIIKHERVNVITSKALSFVMKIR